MADFEIVRRDGRTRLVASSGVKPAEFAAIAQALGVASKRFRKVGFVAARRVTQSERVETVWNGKETANTAKDGDWVVTNLTPQRAVLRDRSGNPNIYVIRRDVFARLYVRDEAGGSIEAGDIYRSISTVMAIELDGGFEILAPWGEMQTAEAGYLLNPGTEVYGNNVETFRATYVPAD